MHIYVEYAVILAAARFSFLIGYLPGASEQQRKDPQLQHLSDTTSMQQYWMSVYLRSNGCVSPPPPPLSDLESRIGTFECLACSCYDKSPTQPLR